MPKWWSFGQKKSVDQEALFLEQEAELRLRFDEAVSNGHPRQQLLFQIEQESLRLERAEETAVGKAKLRAYDLLYGEIRSSMFANLTNGKNHEMAGQIEAAIQCYHKALNDQVPTRFPYEHLRVIYNRRSQAEKAQQVCKKALQNPYLSEKDHDHFQQWLAKLNAIASASETAA